MRDVFKKNILVGMIRLIACLSLMNCPALAGGTSSLTTITSINLRDVSTDLYVSGFNNPDGCTQSGVIRLANGVTNFQSITAGAITAFSMGRSIKVYANGCGSDGVCLILSLWIF